MAISVTPTAQISNGNSTSGAAGSSTVGGLASEPAAAGDFASLLAGQIGDISQFLASSTSESPLALPALSGHEADEDLLASGESDDTNTGPLSTFALLDVLAIRAGNSKQDISDESSLGSRRGCDVLISEEFRNATKTSLSSNNPITLTAAKPLTDMALLDNSEPAKVAGDPVSATPTSSAGAFAAQERASNAARTDNQQSISTPMHDPRWAQQLGERVAWLARGNVQNAQININPAQLGPIQINISLNGDQMTANFVSAHQEVRQALEDAMPRLREMLSGAGINLGQSNVGSQAQQQARQDSSPQTRDTPRYGSEDAILPQDKPTDSRITGLPIQRGRGMVDLFA